MTIEITPNPKGPPVLGGDIVIASGDPSWLGRTMPPCDPTYYRLVMERQRSLGETIPALADEHEIPTPRRAFQLWLISKERDEENWLTNVVCRLTEVTEVIDDPELLREKVIICANLLVGWVEQLDREIAAG